MTDMLESAPRQSNPPATDKLAGRVAFITGGTGGIGAAIAHSLACQGATVAVGYNRDSAERFVADPPGTVRRILAMAGLEDAALPFVSPSEASTSVHTMCDGACFAAVV